MADPIYLSGDFIEGENLTSVARVALPDGTMILQASFPGGTDHWDLRLFDLSSSTASTAIYSLLIQPASAVIFDTLQTDGYWSKDGTGYNFRHTIAATSFTSTGGHTYRAEYKLKTTNFGTLWVIGLYTCQGVLGE